MTIEKNQKGQSVSRLSRRSVLKSALVGATSIAAPGLLIGNAHASGQFMDLESIRGAAIDWQMAKG